LFLAILFALYGRKVLFDILDQPMLEALLFAAMEKNLTADVLLRIIFETHSLPETMIKCKFDVLSSARLAEYASLCVTQPTDERFQSLAAISKLSSDMADKTFSALAESSPELVRFDLLPAFLIAIPRCTSIPPNYAAGLLVRLLNLAELFPASHELAKVAVELLQKPGIINEEQKQAAMNSILSTTGPLLPSQVLLAEAIGRFLESDEARARFALHCL
jgi:hypothetical protein